jgi:hypothetical protein
MKINYKKITLWICLIVVVIILPDASMYYQRYKLSQVKLPDQYKNYTTLDSLKDAAYEVIEINGGFTEPPLQVNDSTIALILGHPNLGKDRDGLKNTWYKINLRGKITDSLSYQYKTSENHSYQVFNGDIVDVDRNTYNTWIKNNDTTNHPIKNLAENKVFSKEEASKMITGKTYMYSNHINVGQGDAETAVKLLIYQDGTWSYLLTDKSWSESPGYHKNPLEVKYEESTFDIDKKPGLLRREFVHKTHWAERSFWNIRKNLSWGTGNGSGGNGWTGNSYFQIQMPDKKLHFKQFVAIDESGFLRDRFNYFVYKPKSGSYLLLDDNQNSRYYLIRPKYHNQ